MHNTLALSSALNQKHAPDPGPPGPLAPVEQMLAELDLEAAQRQSRRVGPLTNITAHRKERAATKRAVRSTLNEIAASLGVSRSTLNRILEKPPLAGERHVEPTERGGDGKRHDHGAGRRRHTGAGGHRHTGVGVLRRRGRVRTA
jgi:hypothetical protein